MKLYDVSMKKLNKKKILIGIEFKVVKGGSGWLSWLSWLKSSQRSEQFSEWNKIMSFTNTEDRGTIKNRVQKKTKKDM